jgi:putative ABC transport system permease protein
LTGKAVHPMKDIQPSKFAVWLLKKFCKEEYLEVFLGDLEEMFYERAQKMSSRKARWLHLLGVLSLFRPFALKKVRLLTYFSNQSIMLRNHFKIALRSLKKNTFYTAINIFGLALGLAAFFLDFHLYPV